LIDSFTLIMPGNKERSRYKKKRRFHGIRPHSMQLPADDTNHDDELMIQIMMMKTLRK